MNRILRTFISINVPNHIMTIRDMLMTTVDDPKSRINWVRKGSIHLTLKFIGPTPEEKLPELKQFIANSLSDVVLPDLKIKGTGCFPTVDRPRVIWLGLDGDLEPIKSLVSKLNLGLKEQGYLHGDIENDYVPHITLGRIKYPPKETPGIGTFLNTSFDPINMRCNRINLVSSSLRPEGAVYSILSTHELKQN